MNRHPRNESDNNGPHSVVKNEHRTLIKNINIFNGTSEDLIKKQDVVICSHEHGTRTSFERGDTCAGAEDGDRQLVMIRNHFFPALFSTRLMIHLKSFLLFS